MGKLTVGRDPQFIVFLTYKAASRSIKQLLREANVQFDLQESGYHYYPEDAYRDYFKFAFVRNPFDRFVSCWSANVLRNNHFGLSNEKLEPLKDFNVFVDWLVDNSDRGWMQNPHFAQQCDVIDLNHLDFLGRFERLESDLGSVFQRLGLTMPELPHRNKSERGDYRSYYDDQSIERVSHLYARDLSLLGYEF